MVPCRANLDMSWKFCIPSDLLKLNFEARGGSSSEWGWRNFPCNVFLTWNRLRVDGWNSLCCCFHSPSTLIEGTCTGRLAWNMSGFPPASFSGFDSLRPRQAENKVEHFLEFFPVLNLSMENLPFLKLYCFTAINDERMPLPNSNVAIKYIHRYFKYLYPTFLIMVPNTNAYYKFQIVWKKALVLVHVFSPTHSHQQKS